ncbi:MAG: 23S rRNA (guanosine(2251)-2'-O)-methyltransferase RlmB [Pseudomonadota bacterium]|nr:23S rRNA (guanosine(2251)-2'-O)-methyltransferase RlmB [Pseudomonadota bacterium]MEC7991754.1 23S rRNA (guanosine(2251)-2'-O)-methyltransferase RlmB [Pseudomonadota bacterium]MEC8697057.1 23S rRNA (guanosine(2251)-2'-O)-methyltransferase RlmB [Pseudomonadota bacterium]
MDEVIGIQATRAVLRDNPQKGRCLYVQRGRRDARMNELISMAKDAGVRFQVVDDAWFKRRAADLKHQGVLLECHARTLADEQALKDAWPQFGEKPLILILDGITDPRNLGACLRTANAAGVNAVILPKRNSAPLSAVALKTAQGGAEDLFIVQVTNLARCLTWLRDQGVWLLGADGEGEQLWHAMDTNVPLGLVMGSEGKGLRRLTRSLCDQLVSIPMLGRVESLNVAVATGVLLFEVVRQRSQPRKVS